MDIDAVRCFRRALDVVFGTMGIKTLPVSTFLKRFVLTDAFSLTLPTMFAIRFDGATLATAHERILWTQAARHTQVFMRDGVFDMNAVFIRRQLQIGVDGTEHRFGRFDIGRVLSKIAVWHRKNRLIDGMRDDT